MNQRICSRRNLLKGLGGIAIASSVGLVLLSKSPEIPDLSKIPKDPLENEVLDDNRTFMKLLESVYSRGYPIGEVLTTRFGLEETALLSLHQDCGLDYFEKWLKETDKKVVTISRLQVPRLRPERPILDGQDIYEGFFALKPDFFDIKAPLEGSISKLRKQGYNFKKEELKALDQMLRTCLCYALDGESKWYPLPVGSRVSIVSGKRPKLEIWVNTGEQLGSVDETIKNAKLNRVKQVLITDPIEVQALNRHYNFSMVAKDEEVKKHSNGEFERVIDRLYDILTQRKYTSKEYL